MSVSLLPRLMVSAPHKSSGKTTVVLGLAAALAGRGERVACFKKGPDYIDPMWHRLASGRESCNLDPWLMGAEGCIRSFAENGLQGTLSLIEGNHGLHDGLSLDGSDSSAGLAAMLRAPVLLVVDSRKMSRGAAAVVLGMQSMQHRVRIAGVILNQVRTARHADKQKLAIETFCNVPVLGAIPSDERLSISERHLGLITTGESSGAEAIVREAAEQVAHYCDIDAVRSLFSEAPPLEHPDAAQVPPIPYNGVRIGVFRDAAFCFYYPENLRALTDKGVELVFIDSMQPRPLPDVHGLYLGGGFPESFFPVLETNRQLMRDVRERAASGMPIYAECGGLIYLSRSGTCEGRTYSLAGVLPFDIGFRSRPAGHGYVELRSVSDSAWFAKDAHVRAHEFHYSFPVSGSEGEHYQFDVMRGTGVTGKRDGVLYRNVLATYAHLHATGTLAWAGRFAALAGEWKSRN